MRKSIFLTVIAMLFAGLLNLYGQDCTPTKQRPTAGVDYIYEVTITGAAGATDKVYDWYITPSTNLLEAGSIYGETNDFFVVSPDESKYHSAVSAETKERIKLKWTNDAIAKQTPFYLVLKYSENNGVCVVQNLKVKEIKPLNTFKLKIAPAEDATGKAFDLAKGANVCVADVVGAEVIPGTSNQGAATSDTRVKYTYGGNELFYKVTASGFVGNWTPKIQLPALDAKQKYVSAQWSDDNGVSWKDFAALQATSAKQELTSPENAAITDAENGSAIIYKVVIDNQSYETLVDQPIAVATDGSGVVGKAQNGLLNDQNDTCTGDEDAFGDKETVTIKARPNINAAAGGFLIEIQ